MRRLTNIQELVTDVFANGTPGDLIETGVWRGGSTIFMRGMLKAHGVTDRSVWVADSFEGFPSTQGQGASARSFTSPELVPLRGYQTRAYAPAVRASLDHVGEGTSLEDVKNALNVTGSWTRK